jgi:NitT/TauT family transport system substrate-binding protein
MGRVANPLIAVIVTLGAMTFGSTVSADEPAKLRLSLATTYSTNFIPYLAAKDLGWLKQEGIETEDIIVNGDANATRALVTGSADIAMTGPLNLFNAVDSGARIKWIGSWQMIVDYDVVAGPGIKSMDDLVDKTFASSGPSGLPQDLPIMLFKKLGIASDRVKFVSVGSHAARLQAVVAGKADAALVNEITAQIGVKSGQVHIVASVPDYFPKLGYVALAVRSDDLANPARRSAFIRFMKASIMGARLVARDPEKGAEILHADVPDLDITLLNDVVKRLTAQKVWAVNGGIDADVVNFTAQLEYELGQVKSRMTADQVVDPSIVEAALKDLGKF